VANNELQTSDIDLQPTVDDETMATVYGTGSTVTDQDGLTTLLSYKEYDPGTKLNEPDKPESENDRFMFQNKVSDIFESHVLFQAKYFYRQCC
jgi:hypothetical protein